MRGPVVTYLLQMWIHFIQVLLKFLTQQIYSKNLDANTHLYYTLEVKNLVLGHISVVAFKEDAVALDTKRTVLATIGAYYISTFLSSNSIHKVLPDEKITLTLAIVWERGGLPNVSKNIRSQTFDSVSDLY